MKKIAYILVGVTLLGSCVPSREFTQVTDKNKVIQEDRDNLLAENEQLTVENREMKSRIDNVEKEKERFKRNLTRGFVPNAKNYRGTGI